MPVVVGALVMIPKSLKQHLEAKGVTIYIKVESVLQNTYRRRSYLEREDC